MSGLVRSLAIETGLPESTVHRIMLSAPVRYKTYQINKRNGGKRTISQPAREVKYLQRAFTKLYLDNCPIHEAATAYRPGLSILDNAAAHSNSGSILKMDFSDFFPSIKKSDWVRYCEIQRVLETAEEIELSASLLFQKPKDSRTRRLAIGAPSSPTLSNILMLEFDTLVAEFCEEDDVTYTRYADDLTFSAPRSWNLRSIERKIPGILRRISFPRLTVHEGKTRHVTSKYQRTVTGLTLANDGKVTIGKARKRVLHATTHAASLGKLNPKEMQKLAGMLAFVNSVEPTFLRVLARRYGSETISHLQQIVVKDRTKYPD
ncbi:retron St85 family RNA-directed DNA polymerase [Tardiphaga sp. 803_E3_N1_3]|uniref:retron St85 family RNA-directed DNA polymerase n=1 Tax=Tardiphaga sp. 803_E3_N1_3 TaxID=3240785 RepID=UPI003F2849C2